MGVERLTGSWSRTHTSTRARFRVSTHLNPQAAAGVLVGVQFPSGPLRNCYRLCAKRLPILVTEVGLGYVRGQGSGKNCSSVAERRDGGPPFQTRRRRFESFQHLVWACRTMGVRCIRTAEMGVRFSSCPPPRRLKCQTKRECYRKVARWTVRTPAARREYQFESGRGNHVFTSTSYAPCGRHLVLSL